MNGCTTRTRDSLSGGMLRNCFTEENLWYLFGRYGIDKTDLMAGSNKGNILVDSIIPSDTLMLSGAGAQILTNRGMLIDFQAMTVNCILGQNDPWVKMQQIAYLLSDRPSFHTTKLGSELYYSLPSRLSGMRLGGIENPVISHRQCNGSDAVEHAIRAAKNYHTDRDLLVSFRGSYHGQNLTAYAVSDVQRKHGFLASFDSVVYLPAPNGAVTIADDVCVTAEEQAGLDHLRQIGRNVFAVILEPVQMNNGVQPFSRAYLEQLREVCNQQDICVIYDEVQTGFGWLGSFSAAEYHQVPPNICAFGKAITAGNGPLALTVAEQRFRHMEYGTASKTNGADVRSLVAAHAVIDRLAGTKGEVPSFLSADLREQLSFGLLATVPAVSHLLWKLMRDTQQRHTPNVGLLKGGGLICGVEINHADGSPAPQYAEAIVEDCFDNGLFLRKSNNVLIVKVPVTITPQQLQDGAAILTQSIATVTGAHNGRQ